MIFWLCLLCILVLGIICVVVGFSIKKIEVNGNQTYTDGEIIREVQKKDYVGNTLVMIAQNRIFGQKYLPFIEDITMSFSDTHTLEIHVKEKLRSGVFEYMNENVYFDSEGIAQESRGYRFDGVPVICDVEGELYKALGLGSAADREELGRNPIVAETVAKAKEAGLVHGEDSGNPLQYPGLFVIAPDGEIRYAFRADAPAGLPSLADAAREAGLR